MALLRMRRIRKCGGKALFKGKQGGKREKSTALEGPGTSGAQERPITERVMRGAGFQKNMPTGRHLKGGGG